MRTGRRLGHGATVFSVLSLRRALAVLPPTSWLDHEEVATVTLTFADRHRRRIRLTDDTGAAFLLELDRATILNDGDGLRLDGGGVIRVIAAPEPVLDVHPYSPTDAARIAWHLGNRHTPIQVLSDGTIRLGDDHVLADMLTGLGAKTVRLSAPFSPEPGAYASGKHVHEAGHDH